ncbi:DNA-directed RNA polymerase subunit delta [Spiroplasma endosymbiont of Aspidapion aeneum]|uniref:DNA-directed RNA polymerase subunit delta n=1 Tax=Spiroplasma endosymbiont of Aspidapion aeneum TaxID=3066276 RepID=UPI00313CD775
MSEIALIDKIYEILKKTKREISFNEIWKKLKKENFINFKKEEETKAEAYTELVLDNRFALTVDGKWCLRDFLKYEDIKKQYSNIDKFMTTEEFDSTVQYRNNDNGDTVAFDVKKISIRDKYGSLEENVLDADLIETLEDEDEYITDSFIDDDFDDTDDYE